MGVFNHDLSAMCLCWHCRSRHRWAPDMTTILNIDTLPNQKSAHKVQMH